MHLSAHWVFPFGHRRINAWLATPRRFSQPPTSFIASWHLGIHRTPLVAYLPKSLVLTPTSRRVLSKLETKVQAQGSSPYGPHFACCACFTCAPSQCVSPWAAANDLRALEVTLETQGQGLENFCSQQKLNSTLRMHFSKSSASRTRQTPKREVWSWTGSNRRHPACKAGALPTELQPRNLWYGVRGTGWRRVTCALPEGGASGGPRWT